ncbi:MAG: hypothetical protein WCF44_10345 [Candidatus Methylophosphatis roskildensis]
MMFLDQPLRGSQLPLVQPEIVGKLDLWLKPEFRLAIGAEDVQMTTRPPRASILYS